MSVVSGENKAPEGHRQFASVAHRHPADPDPVASSKARAVWWLGLLALVFSPMLAGVVPALIALLLARETTDQMRASEGFLTGVRALRAGSRLARLALLVALTVVVVGVVVALLHAGGGASDPVKYGPNVN